VPRADRQLVYIDSYSSLLLSISSLLSLVSSISAVYKACSSCILYVPSHSQIFKIAAHWNAILLDEADVYIE